MKKILPFVKSAKFIVPASLLLVVGAVIAVVAAAKDEDEGDAFLVENPALEN